MASGDKVYIADKATLDEVKGKIGSTTDTGGSSTGGSVFGKLNYLVSQVSTYLSSIYTYVTRIGATNDAQSSSTTTGSIFAKLNYLVNQIGAYLLSIYNNALKIGTTTETGGTATAGTVMGKLNDVIVKNGKLADKNGGFLTAISVLEGAVMPEVSRSESRSSAPGVIGVDDTSIYIMIHNEVAGSFTIEKTNKTTFVKISETIPQICSSAKALMDDTHIYFFNSTSKKIVKFLKSDMSQALESVGTYILGSNVVCMDSTHIYICEYGLKKIIKLLKSDLSNVGESATDSTLFSIFGMQVDNSYVFLSVERKLYKYNKSDLTKVQMTPTINNLTTFYCDWEDSGYIYYAAGTSTIWSVIKVDKNFVNISQFYWSVVTSYGTALTGDTDFIYVVDYTNKRIIRLDKQTLSLSAITENLSEGSGSIVCDNNFIYATEAIVKAVIKYDKITTLQKYQISGYTKE